MKKRINLTDWLLLLFAKIANLAVKKILNIIDYRIFKRDMHAYKYKRLHDEIWAYYMDIIKNKPELLAYDLASRDMKELERRNRVEKMYTRKFVKQCAK